MKAFWGWMAGRKTYIMAGLVLAVTFTLVFLQRLTPTTAFAVVMFAVSGFAATFRSALQRHQAESVAILIDIAAAGKAAAGHNSVALGGSLMQAAQDSGKLADEIHAESAS
jgi:hypothetical protein